MIPETLNEWTFNRVADLTEKGICEGITHDFKADIPETGTLTKVCCAFANTSGGFLVFGIRQNDHKWSIVGVQKNLEFSSIFGNKVKATPSIYFESPKILDIPDSERKLYIVEVPKSKSSPHVTNIEAGKRNFYKRTNSGNEFMDYEEIKLAFRISQDRRELVKLLFIELLENKERLALLIQPISSEYSNYPILTLESEIMSRLLVEAYSVIGQNDELIKLLNVIRRNIITVNNKVRIYMNQVSMPLSNQASVTMNHNQFIFSMGKLLIGNIDKACSEIEKEFQIRSAG